MIWQLRKIKEDFIYAEIDAVEDAPLKKTELHALRWQYFKIFHSN